LASPLPGNSLGQAAHTHVPVTKQYNLRELNFELVKFESSFEFKTKASNIRTLFNIPSWNWHCSFEDMHF